jgi:polysaccharide chain length determinant protein (PEP-CTERM system associated)
MQEILLQFFTHVWGIWRHRWLAMIVAWMVAIGGWLWVWQLPEAYVASARIYVDTNNVLRPLMSGLAIQPNISQRIAMMSQTLLSRPNLEKLMRMTDLDLQVNTDRQRNEMLADLGKAIRLSGDRRNASLYSIKVEDPDRDTAKNIAQALITVFIEGSLSGKRADNSGAQDFLDVQIAEYEKRLMAAENRLALFKQEYVDVLPSSGGGYYKRLEGARGDLGQARLQLSEMQHRQQELQRQVDGEDPVFISSGVAGSAASSPLDTRIQAMHADLDRLLTRYTNKHPAVRQLASLIAELEAEKTAEYERLREGDGYSGFSNSPVYQGMRSMLGETEARVAELQVRATEYEERVNDLNAKVGNVPEIEAQLKQLDRDYGVISGQHNKLLQRRESARLSTDLEQNASDVRFRVIDPPFVPMKPNEPNKLFLNGGVLLVGIAAGIGFALFLSLLSPVISDPRALATVTGLPLLGSVTDILPLEQKRRERIALATYASLGAGLLIAYIGMSFGQGVLLPI